MLCHTQAAPVLIFAFGNPSRGDDALGPALYDRLEKMKRETDRLDGVDLLTDYQLQIEHAVDLEQRQNVLFIDAGISCSPPYAFQQLHAEQDNSYSTHAMSPAAVLAVYRQINQHEPPPSYLLTIRGYEFALGQAISTEAKTNLEHGFEFIKRLLESDFENWQQVIHTEW